MLNDNLNSCKESDRPMVPEIFSNERKYSVSGEEKNKEVKSSGEIGHFFLEAIFKEKYHLLCTIEPISSVFNSFILGKLEIIFSYCEKYIQKIQFNLQNKNSIEVEFLPLVSSEFYGKLIHFIDFLLDLKFRELTKISSDYPVLKIKEYGTWINEILIDQEKAFNQVICTNQKTTTKKRYTSLVEIDADTLEYKTLAKTNDLDHITANSSLSGYAFQGFQKSKHKLISRFDLHDLSHQGNKPSDIKDPQKSLIILALGSLDSIQSFFKLLIKLRLLEMNILISVLKNTPDVVQKKQASFLNLEIKIVQNSVGALATSKTAGSYAIAYNATYLNNLLALFGFKIFLIKETRHLLVYYALSDKKIKIFPTRKQITKNTVPSIELQPTQKKFRSLNELESRKNRQSLFRLNKNSMMIFGTGLTVIGIKLAINFIKNNSKPAPSL